MRGARTRARDGAARRGRPHTAMVARRHGEARPRSRARHGGGCARAAPFATLVIVMSDARSLDFRVKSLGAPHITSPVRFSTEYGDCIANYVPESDKIIFQVDLFQRNIANTTIADLGLVERAGPREQIYFDPPNVRAAILTCGGLCPGINDVVRGVVRGLWFRYGVRNIFGIRYGYHGLLPESRESILKLTPENTEGIHRGGGSMLGSSRGGGERSNEIVDEVERLNLNILFIIGGDGTQKGALDISQEIERRGLKIAVVGVPKTIDNDISFVQRSFGFETAVAKATEAVWSAHAEASSAANGIGLVKVMGRESGFIAAHTAIASHVVDIALIPEVPFLMGGAQGFLTVLERRIKEHGSAVVVVAEGAGQDILTQQLESEHKQDASGNILLSDIGEYLQQEIKRYFKDQQVGVNLKYINPSYIIRSAVATPADSLYCSRLATHAVHAAMAGKTQVMISLINNHFVNLPIALAVSARNQIDPESSLWRDVIDSTGQPLVMNNINAVGKIDRQRLGSEGAAAAQLLTSAGSNS